MMLAYLDFSTGSWIDAYAAEYARRGAEVSILPFVYGVDFLPLAASSTARDTWTVEHDSDFLITHQSHVSADSNGDGFAAPNVTISIRNMSSGRDLQNAPAHLMNIFGQMGRPLALQKPLLLPSKTAIEIQAINLTALATFVQLSFIGVKMFPRRSDAAA